LARVLRGIRRRKRKMETRGTEWKPGGREWYGDKRKIGKGIKGNKKT
jgi:hypothetical protein